MLEREVYIGSFLLAIMGCMQVQQRAFHSSYSGMTHESSLSRGVTVRAFPIPKKALCSPENWKWRATRTLSRLVESTIDFAWVPRVKIAISNWNTDEDSQWIKSLKLFYARMSHELSTKPSSCQSKKHSVWRLPGMSTESLLEESDYMNFLEKTLRCSRSHGIAYMLSAFCQAFKETYSEEKNDEGRLADFMKRDILEFSRLAEEALEHFYDPVDILKVFGKSKRYLELVIREVILEDVEVKRMLIEAIKATRVKEDGLLRVHYSLRHHCDLSEIDPAVRPELLEISRSDPGFNASVIMLQEFASLPSLTEQVQTVFNISEAVSDAVVYVFGTSVQLFLSADDLLTLTTFLVLRAASEDLAAHIDLISSLVPSDVMADATSYSLATLETALEYIARKPPLPP